LNVSSINGILPYCLIAPPTLGQGGGQLLTLSMAIDLAAYGIRVNAIIRGRSNRAKMRMPPSPDQSYVMGRVV
jgi:NAD(P)-dependent dehydrogenase (short-subunit alcohol dehydrogenase family)